MFSHIRMGISYENTHMEHPMHIWADIFTWAGHLYMLKSTMLYL